MSTSADDDVIVGPGPRQDTSTTSSADSDSLIGSTGIAGAPAVTSTTGPTGLLSRSWPSLADAAKLSPPPVDSPANLGRVAAAETARTGISTIDKILQPEEMVLAPLRAGVVAAQHWLGPKLGYAPWTPQQQADVLGTTPLDQGPVTAAVSDRLPPGPTNPYSVLPQTELQARIAALTSGVYGGAMLGPRGPGLGPILGGAGAVAGQEAASRVDPAYAPLTDFAVNAAVQTVPNMALPARTFGVDPPVARIAEQGRAQDVPFTAADIIPNTPYRTPTSVAGTTDALQGNLIRFLGGDPNNVGPDPNRITPAWLKQNRQDIGTNMDNFAANVTAQPQQTLPMLTTLKQIDGTIDTTPGLDASDRAAAHKQIAEIYKSVDPQTGRMQGADFQAITRTSAPLDDLRNDGNPNLARIGGRIYNAVSDGYQAAMTPDQAAAYANLRAQYRLNKTLEPVVADRQGRTFDADTMGDVANSFVKQTGDYGSPPVGSPLLDFQRQASVINEGATPQQPKGPLASVNITPQSLMAWGINPHVAGAVTGIQSALDTLGDVRGAYLRSDFKTRMLLQNILNPPSAKYRAGEGLLGASVGPSYGADIPSIR